ncbi:MULTISPECIES: GntR family transcriptional regulator [Halomonadaceae]|uniref:Pyruvate dehydrogenase complex repressor n=2 Tax=Vreelandella TaxID=3137766 RepID=A0A7Z0S101_9GAMM|nr:MULTISPECIES: GntR family transcriptional regulator [Halomonas]AJY52692.1 regulatory protein GntR HTH [Halomonas sp. KO116]NYS80208.1 GntR family transcriptional regulator [Halomonas glaciei]|tara:strand:+ start:388 stop:1161 length:774 start_codon:yes stop_codon:yes gene_type:complete
MSYPPLRQQRLADVITERLEAMMLEGSLKPGQRLPPERELAERFGVSRPSLREAIQKLAARGLLTSRQGGGTFVNDDLSNGYTDPLLEMLSRHGEFNLDLLEFRDAMEGISAYYAALRSTPADKAVLIQRFEELDGGFAGADPIQEAKLDAAFHLAIAEAAHNVLLLHTIRGIFHLLEKSIVNNLAHLFAKEGSRSQLMQQHRALLNAILEGRAEDARTRAHEHLVFVEEGLLEMARAETRAQRALRRAQGNSKTPA